MAIGKIKLTDFVRAARRDNIAAMCLLPDGADISTIGRLPFVIAQSDETAKRVLIDDVDSYRKPWIVRQVITDGLGENLFTAAGDAWLRRRKPVAPVFGLHNLDALEAIMRDTVDQAVASWQPGEVDIQDAMTDLTIRVALRGLLGVDDSDELARDIREAFEVILDWVNYRFNNPASPPVQVPSPRNRQLKAARADMRAAVESVLVQQRAVGGESFDILGQLLLAQADDPESTLTDKAIVDECIGFLFAGHETTASTLTWALYELSLQPDLQQALAHDGTALSTADGVIRESLRMYPAGISIVRSATRSTTLAGRRVRRGTLVMIPVYAIQRSEMYWDNPDTFDPSRGEDSFKTGYLPFGLGPRRCLGARFARTELQIALTRICARWQLQYNQPEPPRQITAPSLRAEGQLPVTLEPR